MRRLLQAVRAASAIAERCELCAAPLPTTHEHLYETASRGVCCACDACARMVGGERWRRVPRRAQRVAIDDAGAWLERLNVPVGVAALIARSGGARAVVAYPGAAGMAESEVEAVQWEAVRQALPVARGLEADVEALLLSRLDGASEMWAVGIDVVFRLVAEVRRSWRGMTGGTGPAAAVVQCLDQLRGRA